MSEHHSTSAAHPSCSEVSFIAWAKRANLDPAIHDELSSELQSLLDATRTLPVELGDEV